MKILIAILIFGVIIAVHELGHFIAAKSCGVRVNEFAIGMGPALFKKKKGETLYALRLFPIGGYCAMEGEDAESEDDRAFNKKKTWQKIIIIVAGAVMNIVLGFILMVIMVSMGGDITSTTISGFYPNAKTQQTGLEVGDKIVKINGSNIYIDGDISYQFMNDDDATFNMEVIRDGKKVKLDNVQFDTIKSAENTKPKMVIDFVVQPIKKNVISVMDYSVKKTYYVSKIVFVSLGDIIQGKYKLNDLSGPVGIVNAIGEVITPSQSFMENLEMAINMAIFITINVGIFNLLPLPALDGGRMIFRIGEAITKKRIKPEVEGMIHFVGLALLMLLMVVVTFNDISKILK